MINLKQLVCIGTLTLTAITASQAALIDNNNYTTDGATGLDWRDISDTINYSYNDVLANQSVGGLFDGWRYANEHEFNALINNYLNISEPDSIIREYDGSLSGLSEMMGFTFSNNTERAGIGLLSTGSADNVRYLAEVFDSVIQNDWSHSRAGAKYVTESSSWWGSYLVRDTFIPVPDEPELPIPTEDITLLTSNNLPINNATTVPTFSALYLLSIGGLLLIGFRSSHLKQNRIQFT